MRAVALAYGNVGCEGIEALLAGGVEIAAVFTHVDRTDENTWFRSVAELAARRELPVFAPDDINHPHWVEKIRSLGPDILFSFYYRQLVGRTILDIPPAGCLNLHGSLLPAYRGRAPANWAILNGETVTGVTLHHMIDKADAGDIVCQQRVPIAADDDARTLNLKLAAAAGSMMRDVLPQILDGSAPRVPQASEEASHYGRRRPADGRIDWSRPAVDVHNLVRAVTLPYPGAFGFAGKEKITIWTSQPLPGRSDTRQPGTILASDPLDIACGTGVLRIVHAQSEGGVFCRGAQLAGDLNLVAGTHLKSHPPRRRRNRKARVLILGVNGFIGNFLSERLLESGRYEIHGMDLNDSAIRRLVRHADFHFHEGDITIHSEWIEYHIRKCDIVVPLVAIATPIEYTRNPLRVFELDFEENLRIVRHCVRYGKRLVFPSTSEVYGMCADREFDEDRSRLVLGPINKQRWIYSASKQLLDRVIWAYGRTEAFRFTLFRPFNWIGPRLDSLDSARIGSSRAITQLILNLVEGTPIQLIDGGAQKRCFTDVAEGIECLFRIIENANDNCDGQIINIGNPDNEASIRDLAGLLTALFERHPLREYFPPCAGMQVVESSRYYGDGYEDVEHRRPSIGNARRLLDWRPIIPLRQSVEMTLDFFLREHLACDGKAEGATRPLAELRGRMPMANTAAR